MLGWEFRLHERPNGMILDQAYVIGDFDKLKNIISQLPSMNTMFLRFTSVGLWPPRYMKPIARNYLVTVLPLRQNGLSICSILLRECVPDAAVSPSRGKIRSRDFYPKHGTVCSCPSKYPECPTKCTEDKRGE